MTFKHFCDLLDETEFSYVPSEEDQRVVIRVKEDIFILFIVKSNMIQARAFVEDKISSDRVAQALLFCNKWNSEKLTPKIFLDDDRDFQLGNTLFTVNMDPNDEWVKYNFIRFSVGAIVSAIEEIKENF